MNSKLFLFLILLPCSFLLHGKLDCPTLTVPLNGSTDVPVTTNITWNEVIGAPGYIISIGTSPGGTDIINERTVGNATTYKPPFGLPSNTEIYITISISFFNADNIICETEMFHTENVTTPPACTTLVSPIDGATNIKTNTRISWNYAPTATGYLLSLGTVVGGTDLLLNADIAGETFYQPTIDLPADTQIFATVTPYNTIGNSTAICNSISFFTSSIETIPDCTSLISPMNGEINVALSPIIEWTLIPDATGYKITIGTTPFNANVLDNVTIYTNRTPFLNFEPNLTFFIKIAPFNSAGEAIGCSQESFSTILGCGPYYDVNTDTFIDLKPIINLADSFYICDNEPSVLMTSTDDAEGFRWFKLDDNDNETLLDSSNNEISITEEGRYLYEAYNTITQSGLIIECANSKVFSVTQSQAATDISTTVIDQNEVQSITVHNSGLGEYEYAIDSINGPYQNDSNFKNITSGTHILFVRNKNGCGITEFEFKSEITVEGFPKFFTPNADGVNDFWQFTQTSKNLSSTINHITIFDRYGNFLLQLDPQTRGWNGNIRGKQMPASDYWFTAIFTDQQNVSGHFTLKR